MRNIDAYMEEIAMRSEKRILRRRKIWVSVLTSCMSMALCVGAVFLTVALEKRYRAENTPLYGQEEFEPAPEEMATNGAGVTLRISGKDGKLLKTVTDSGHAAKAHRMIRDILTLPSGEVTNAGDMTTETATDAELYTFAFTGSGKEDSTYTLKGSSLTDETTQQQRQLTEGELMRLLALVE